MEATRPQGRKVRGKWAAGGQDQRPLSQALLGRGGRVLPGPTSPPKFPVATRTCPPFLVFSSIWRGCAHPPRRGCSSGETLLPVTWERAGDQEQLSPPCTSASPAAVGQHPTTRGPGIGPGLGHGPGRRVGGARAAGPSKPATRHRGNRTGLAGRRRARGTPAPGIPAQLPARWARPSGGGQESGAGGRESESGGPGSGAEDVAGSRPPPGGGRPQAVPAAPAPPPGPGSRVTPGSDPLRAALTRRAAAAAPRRGRGGGGAGLGPPPRGWAGRLFAEEETEAVFLCYPRPSNPGLHPGLAGSGTALSQPALPLGVTVPLPGTGWKLFASARLPLPSFFSRPHPGDEQVL